MKINCIIVCVLLFFLVNSCVSVKLTREDVLKNTNISTKMYFLYKGVKYNNLYDLKLKHSNDKNKEDATLICYYKATNTYNESIHPAIILASLFIDSGTRQNMAELITKSGEYDFKNNTEIISYMLPSFFIDWVPNNEKYNIYIKIDFIIRSNNKKIDKKYKNMDRIIRIIEWTPPPVKTTDT